mmetsp:Transcript_40225/g.94571  ORF Transcript_40225/g.94571 Transcript_40225/m.94571 type:complete len:284 (+) Transcript_40225:120-971(+)
MSSSPPVNQFLCTEISRLKVTDHGLNNPASPRPSPSHHLPPEINNVVNTENRFPQPSGRPRSRQGSRHGSRNQNRHIKFIRWVLSDERFPSISRNERPDQRIPVVLDVAGGRGENTIRLGLCNGINSILVDPRTADDNTIIKCLFVHVIPRLPKRWSVRMKARFGHLYGNAGSQLPDDNDAADVNQNEKGVVERLENNECSANNSSSKFCAHVRHPLGETQTSVAVLPSYFAYDKIIACSSSGSFSNVSPVSQITPEETLASIITGTSEVYFPTLLLGLHADQ